MRGLWTCAFVAAAGCGRIDFAPLGDATATLACPAGYVAVRGNVALGTDDFCVMQAEARAGTDDDGCPTAACNSDWAAPLPLPLGTPSPQQPWRSVSQQVAYDACKSLGPGYSLISNREWMTLARDAESVGDNWSGGTPGAGRLVEGNTDNGPYAGISDALDPYSDTGNTAADPADMGWEQRRTLTLSNGSIVWDLPGNVQEWADWTRGEPLDGPPGCTGAELPAFSCAGVANDDYNSSTGTLDSSAGAGIVIGGSGHALRRGGQASDRANGFAGIYALNVNRAPTGDIFSGTGFRCVYHPPGAPDRDADFVADAIDNCPDTANPEQWNEDGDSFGDACDPCPPLADVLPVDDADGDGVSGLCDPKPGIAGERIALFDGFNTVPRISQAQIDGTWTFDGFARVVSTLDSESAVTWIVPTLGTTYVSSEASDDSYIGDLTPRPIGVITQYDRASRNNTMCVFGINPSNTQVIALADNLTASVHTALTVADVVDVTARLVMRETGPSKTCDVTLSNIGLAANASLISTPNRMGIFARSASAHFGWAMIVTAP